MAETNTKEKLKNTKAKPVVTSAKTDVKKPSTATSAKPVAKPAIDSAKPVAKEPTAIKRATATKSSEAKPADQFTAETKVTTVSDEQRYRMVAEAAYYHAERNKFKSDHVRDWIDAERDIDALLSGGK